MANAPTFERGSAEVSQMAAHLGRDKGCGTCCQMSKDGDRVVLVLKGYDGNSHCHSLGCHRRKCDLTSF